jgi:eukaryotic-like serine/threonine-protein kinase
MSDIAASLGAAVADRYRILRELGRGGMAVVYLADDLKHARRVAIKVLAREVGESVGGDRFLREIEIAARLSHPRIVPFLDSGSADGLLYYVMPYVEGESLAARLEREKQLPVEEAVDIARQVASALSYAHEQGVVHRDIKPENILLSGAEAVVADFGIARALTAAGGTSLTRSGLVVGTPLYMSPEQAGGAGAADPRTDIYALGCVLYEMLAGEPPFEARTAQAIAARKLSESAPDVRRVRESTPPAVAAAVRKALARMPADRHRTAAALSDALRRAVAGDPVEPAGSAPDPGRSRRRASLPALAALLAVLVAAGALGWAVRGGSSTLLVELPLEDSSELGARLALSPDGRRLAYVSGGRLWIRDLGGLEQRAVPGSEGAVLPFWSPDGTEIGFVADERLWRASAAGGESVPVSPTGGLAGGAGATWTREGQIVFGTGGTALQVVPAAGGTPRDLIPLEPGEDDHHQPHALPGGRGIVFVSHRGNRMDTIELLADGERRELLRLEGRAIGWPVYSRTGHLLFASGGGVWAVPFSLRRLAVTGDPFLVHSAARMPSTAAAGTLAFFRGATAPGRRLAIVDREGRLDLLLDDLGPVQYFDYAPSGDLVAVSIGTPADLWIVDPDRGTLSQPTPGTEGGNFPRWSPDGSRIAYFGRAADGEIGLRVRRADGTGSSRAVARGWYSSFTPDGRQVVLTLGHPIPDDQWNIGYVDLEEAGEPVPLLTSPARECCQHVSPDGRYLAYVSDASGRWEVYLTRFPSAEGSWRVSSDGGAWPRWDPRGGRLYYVQGLDVMEVAVTTEPALQLGSPRRLFSRPARVQGIRYGLPDYFDVRPDGERFLVVLPDEVDEAGGSLVVVGDWRSALQR